MRLLWVIWLLGLTASSLAVEVPVQEPSSVRFDRAAKSQENDWHWQKEESDVIDGSEHGTTDGRETQPRRIIPDLPDTNPQTQLTDDASDEERSVSDVIGLEFATFC